jgi:hypothetical protein
LHKAPLATLLHSKAAFAGRLAVLGVPEHAEAAAEAEAEAAAAAVVAVQARYQLHQRCVQMMCHILQPAGIGEIV